VVVLSEQRKHPGFSSTAELYFNISHMIGNKGGMRNVWNFRGGSAEAPLSHLRGGANDKNKKEKDKHLLKLKQHIKYRAIENKKIEIAMVNTFQLAARKNLIQMSLQC
jgi:hypothetical protein